MPVTDSGPSDGGGLHHSMTPSPDPADPAYATSASEAEESDASLVPVTPVEELPVVEPAITLDAAIHLIAESGPTPDDVLGELVRDAGLLMDAPTRIASVLDDRLVWTAAYGDDKVDLALRFSSRTPPAARPGVRR